MSQCQSISRKGCLPRCLVLCFTADDATLLVNEMVQKQAPELSRLYQAMRSRQILKQERGSIFGLRCFQISPSNITDTRPQTSDRLLTDTHLEAFKKFITSPPYLSPLPTLNLVLLPLVTACLQITACVWSQLGLWSTPPRLHLGTYLYIFFLFQEVELKIAAPKVSNQPSHSILWRHMLFSIVTKATSNYAFGRNISFTPI